MRYDLSNDFDTQKARMKFEAMISKKAVIEITEKRQRTLSQNNYLHVILSYLGLCTGNTLEYVKSYYYKQHCNPELFVRKVKDKLTGEQVTTLRSSSELTKEEMSLSIERFRNFSAKEADVYIPTAEEGAFLRQIEMDIEKARQFL